MWPFGFPWSLLLAFHIAASSRILTPESLSYILDPASSGLVSRLTDPHQAKKLLTLATLKVVSIKCIYSPNLYNTYIGEPYTNGKIRQNPSLTFSQVFNRMLNSPNSSQKPFCILDFLAKLAAPGYDFLDSVNSRI